MSWDIFSLVIWHDKKLNIPGRQGLDHSQRELEAESVAYLVCKRNGVKPKSETYLAHHVKKNTTIDHIDVYQVMRAAGQVEALLDLTAQSKYKNLLSLAQGPLMH